MVITDSREEVEKKSPGNTVYWFVLPLPPNMNQFREILQYILFLEEEQGPTPRLVEWL